MPRRDALKVLSEGTTADQEFRERFNREADLAATLWHPHIVAVHDRGEFDGHLWIAMDYVEGTDAARLMRERFRGGMADDDVCAIVTAVAGALDYAHARGLLHRDVKPANILLTHPDEDDRRILLADFGVARQLADISGITETNVAVGTVAYAAPEQLVGSNIDGRADQYALAASAFHLLTGAPPYQNSNPVAVIGQHLHAAPPRLSDYRPDLADLDDVFFKALAKDPVGPIRPVPPVRRGVQRARLLPPGRRSRLHAENPPHRLLEGRATTFPEGRYCPRDDRHDRRRADRDVGDLVLLLGRPAASEPRVAAAGEQDVDLGVGPRGAAAERQLPAGLRPRQADVQRRHPYQRRRHQLVGLFLRVHRDRVRRHRAPSWTTRVIKSAKTAGTGNTGVLHFVDGHWQSEPRQVQVQCRNARGGPMSTQSETVVWSLTPEPDGTLRGVQTQTVQSNECGSQGATLRIPVVASRTGDVPPDVTVADPAQAANTTATPVGTATPAVLGGPCTDIDKVAFDSTANEQVVCEGNTWDKAPPTTGVHPVGTSCDDTPVFTMSKSDDGHLIECDPGTRVWSSQHS